jgi:DNA-binding transcriptional MerR regulator
VTNVSDSDTGRELLKISEFADRAGVPAATIKHYLREGLLPQPLRTSRNMAYYDAAWVPKVRTIKRLQRRLMLPLKVIRDVLEIADDGELPDALVIEATVARVLSEQAPRDTMSKSQAVAQGMTADELELFSRMQLLRADDRGEFHGDDAALTRLLGQARRAGLTSDMLPPEILQDYVGAIQALVRAEIRMFQYGVIPRAEDDVVRLTEAAANLSERLVMLLRRKLLLPAIRDAFEETVSSDASDREQAESTDSPSVVANSAHW